MLVLICFLVLVCSVVLGVCTKLVVKIWCDELTFPLGSCVVTDGNSVAAVAECEVSDVVGVHLTMLLI